MKPLTIVIREPYFSQIKNGEKKEEYREFKPYWKSRIENYLWKECNLCVDLDFDFVKDEGVWDFGKIRFVNGYGKDSPYFDIEFIGILRRTITHPHFGDKPVDCFVLKLGEIIEED